MGQIVWNLWLVVTNMVCLLVVRFVSCVTQTFSCYSRIIPGFGLVILSNVM